MLTLLIPDQDSHFSQDLSHMDGYGYETTQVGPKENYDVTTLPSLPINKIFLIYVGNL